MPFVISLLIPVTCLCIATALSIVHLLWYGIRYPWYESHAGRSFFAMVSSVFVALALSAVNMLVPFYVGELIIDTFVFAAIGAANAYLIYATTIPSKDKEIRNKVSANSTDKEGDPS